MTHAPMHRAVFLFTLVAFTLVAAIGCEAQRAVPMPPANSYTTKTVQVKIGEAVVTANAGAVTPEFFRTVNIRPCSAPLRASTSKRHDSSNC